MNKDKKNIEFDEDASFKDFFEDEDVETQDIENFDEEDEQSVRVSDEEEISVDTEKSIAVEATDEEFVSSVQTESPKKAEKAKKKFYYSVYDLVSIIMSSFVIIALIFTFAFRLVGVDGESMTNTLQHGDWLIAVNKPEYKYGDIVVITQDTFFHEPLIKRVIATEGQVVDVDYLNATFFVDGKPLDEPYVREDFLLEKAEYRQFPYKVPKGCLFCMGDNRNYSSDSRTDLVGPIDKRQILGKAVIRLLPFGDYNIYDYE